MIRNGSISSMIDRDECMLNEATNTMSYLEGKCDAKGLGGLLFFLLLQEVMVLRATLDEIKSSLSLGGMPILLTMTSSWCCGLSPDWYLEQSDNHTRKGGGRLDIRGW